MKELKKLWVKYRQEASVDDGKVFPKVMQQVWDRPKTVIGDGAYDDRDVRDLIRKKGGKALIPPASNGVCPRYGS